MTWKIPLDRRCCFCFCDQEQRDKLWPGCISSRSLAVRVFAWPVSLPRAGQAALVPRWLIDGPSGCVEVHTTRFDALIHYHIVDCGVHYCSRVPDGRARRRGAVQGAIGSLQISEEQAWGGPIDEQAGVGQRLQLVTTPQCSAKLVQTHGALPCYAPGLA